MRHYSGWFRFISFRPLSDHGGEGGVVVSNSISRNRPDMDAACMGSDDSRGSEVTLVRGPGATGGAVSSAGDFMFGVELWKK